MAPKKKDAGKGLEPASAAPTGPTPTQPLPRHLTVVYLSNIGSGKGTFICSFIRDQSDSGLSDCDPCFFELAIAKEPIRFNSKERGAYCYIHLATMHPLETVRNFLPPNTEVSQRWKALVMSLTGPTTATLTASESCRLYQIKVPTQYVSFGHSVFASYASASTSTKVTTYTDGQLLPLFPINTLLLNFKSTNGPVAADIINSWLAETFDSQGEQIRKELDDVHERLKRKDDIPVAVIIKSFLHPLLSLLQDKEEKITLSEGKLFINLLSNSGYITNTHRPCRRGSGEADAGRSQSLPRCKAPGLEPGQRC
jgi:hypothetical protein